MATNDSYVTSTALSALGKMDDERSAQHLLMAVSEGSLYAATAAHYLAERGDIRAIPHLVHFLISRDPRDLHLGNIASTLIAQYLNDAAYLALEPLTKDANDEIRGRAITGVGHIAFATRDKSLKAKARNLLQSLLQIEKHPELRRSIEIFIEISGKKKFGIEPSPFT